MRTLRLGLLAGTVSVLALMAPAKADVVTGFFTSDHCTGNCLTGQTNGGSVSVTGSGTELASNVIGTLTFNINLANGNQFINSGFEASFGFNLQDNPTITYTSYPSATYTIPGVTNVNQQAAGSLHMDGTGFFEYGLDGIGSGGSDPLGSTLTFIISAPGLDLTDLAQNANLQFAAADIISGTAGPVNSRNTGGIDVSSGLSVNPQCTQPGGCVSQVPEPGSLALLGSGLTSLGIVGSILWWRRRRDEDNGNALAS